VNIELPSDAVAALREEALAQARSTASEVPRAHLLLRLRPIVDALERAVTARAGRMLELARPGSPIGAAHAERLLDDVGALLCRAAPVGHDFTLEGEDAEAERALRLAARQAGCSLPIDDLVVALGLDPAELATLLVCAAPHFDPAFGRLFGFIHDDLNRLLPGPQTLALLIDGRPSLGTRQRALFAPHGRLSRFGLIRQAGQATTEIAREFVLAPGLLDGLLGFGTDWLRAFPDTAAIATDDALPLALFPDGDALATAAATVRSGEAATIGLWGVPAAAPEEAARSLAAAAGKPLRRLSAQLDGDAMTEALGIADALDAALLVVPDTLENEAERELYAGALARWSGPLILAGRRAWRPPRLAGSRAGHDLRLTAPNWHQRAAFWQAFTPEAGEETCRALAGDFAYGPAQIRTIANGAAMDRGEPEAGSLALRAAAVRFASLEAPAHVEVILPQRRPEELILPEALHRRVLDVARFYRGRAEVDEEWGFARLGARGVKLLMTGDSGTGKTAAAEVIAGLSGAGCPLFKIDLASVVSKWVGETEKHLDEVFDHAEGCNAALFFDEADSLFAKRGEVERGSDRYANLEVGFLLQKLEGFPGLAILASNHKDQIDEAFMRRFQLVLHFPRPTGAERRKLWNLALPTDAPLGADIDLAAFDALDMTGAAIANAARLAALAAASEGKPIGMTHLVGAVARQFQNESRLLSPAQMGPYATLVADDG
jgi:hypothetical protein